MPKRQSIEPKNPHAVALGRSGGQQRAQEKGWEKIAQERRTAIAKAAAKARWDKRKDPSGPAEE